MAQTSSRSFNQYSGLDQQKANQPGSIPNAQERLSDPAMTRNLQDTAPWALGLADRGAAASGRSFYDPARQAERWVRGTGSREQTMAAEEAQKLNDAADPAEAGRRMSVGAKGRGLVGVGPVAGFNVPIPGQQGSIIPQTVADPGMIQPPPQAPNLFNQSMTNPAMAQSQYSIGAALGGNFLNNVKKRMQNGVSTGISPQIYL